MFVYTVLYISKQERSAQGSCKSKRRLNIPLQESTLLLILKKNADLKNVHIVQWGSLFYNLKSKSKQDFFLF